ncbi:MAG TPA: hypothetical protein VHB73_02115, partial [Alphaproteobacteria bacterium]|nr:hypothetical protein [Alphaproteobacteria bacterium]
VRPDLLLPRHLKTHDDITKYINEKTGGLDKHILVRGERSTGRIVCITLQSRMPDDVMGKILQRAEKAASQMSRQRPSMIALQITDMSPKHLIELFNTSSGIYHIAKQIFEGPPRRPHVNTIAFSALPSVDPLAYDKGISGVSAQVAAIRNPRPRFSSEFIDRQDVFNI